MQWSVLLTLTSALAVCHASRGYEGRGELEDDYLLHGMEREYAEQYLDDYIMRADRNYDEHLERRERNSAEELAKEPPVEIKCNNKEATEFFKRVDKELQKIRHKSSLSGFTYATNVNKENEEMVTKVEMEYNKINEKIIKESHKIDIKTLDPVCARMMKMIRMDSAPRKKEDQKRLSYLLTKLRTGYASAEACNKETGKCYKGETDLVNLFSNIKTTFDQLQWAWKAWADATKPLKKDYIEFVNIMNIGARDNGFSDMGEYWRIHEMDDKDFDKKALEIWDQVKPMYEQLHAYVRQKLIERYPGKLNPRGPIPANLVGNLWGQQWQNILPIVLPYPEAPLADVSNIMRSRGYTVKKMFRTSEAFFASLGLYNMTDKFWKYTMFVDPKTRIVQCHASASDLFAKDRDDYRIKVCAKVGQNDLFTVHHEMGHVEYYMAYRNQFSTFRTGANTGFHEAVGDTIALSVMTPGHLQKIGLGQEVKDNATMAEKRSINFLMRVALEKLAFLPFGLMIDVWRWSVFNGSVTPEQYNHVWWKLRLRFQGQMPPVDRDSSDFDPGSKYHVPDNTPYIRYFVSFLTQFQFHQALCDLAGDKGPLHFCDIYGSKAAGKKLKEMLAMGASKKWEDAMFVLTGKHGLEVTAIKKYFKPLIGWLEKKNKENGNYVGWETTNIGVKY